MVMTGIRNCGYYIKEGMKSIVNNKVMSFASATTVAAALFVFGVFTLLVVNVDSLMSNVENKIEIQAFLRDNVTTIQEKSIERTIDDMPNVKEIKYESKTDALKNYEKQLGENKDYAKGLEKDNPLPASFIIKVDKPESVAGVSSKIKEIKGIEKVNDGQGVVDKVIHVTKIVKVTSFILMIILAVVAIALISNTIKLTVYARKREIGIMKYIGATDWFIKWPFVIEGMVLGFLGAIISIIVLSLGYNYLIGFIQKDAVIFSLVSPYQIMEQLLWQFSLVGVFIGGLGSLISIRKFLVI